MILRVAPKGKVEILDSMPGIAKMSAANIIAEIGDERRFGSESQVASYAGMNSVIQAMHHATHRANIDPARVYLVGHDMAAHAVWRQWALDGLLSQIAFTVSRSSSAFCSMRL